MNRGGRFAVATILATGANAIAIACGARTPLLVPETVDGDAGADVHPDTRRDSSDAPVPELDATSRDANRTDCPDADSTLVYLVSEENDLVSFFPPSASFKTIGKLVCPAPMGATPYSMGVDRKGIAYVAFSAAGFGAFAGLFRVSTATASCASTPFKSNAISFPPDGKFGMGYSTEGAGPAESLYVMGLTGELGRIDFMNNVPIKIANTKPRVDRGELTGTGDGRLYAFYVDGNQGTTHVGEIDTTTGAVLGSDLLPGVDMGTAWAFAFWGGDFYTFTAPGSSTTRVDKYDPGSKKVSFVTGFSGHIVGAGVSTCAPSQ